MSANNSDKFVRWQQLTIGQLGNFTNLILTFSVATIGFAVDKLTNSEFELICFARPYYLLGVVVLFSSILIGLILALNRLLDFRKTMRKTRAVGEEHDQLKRETDLHGELTWLLLCVQVGSFFFGEVFLAISFYFNFTYKLF